MIDEDYLLIVLCFACETVATTTNGMNYRLQLQLMAGRQAGRTRAGRKGNAKVFNNEDGVSNHLLGMAIPQDIVTNHKRVHSRSGNYSILEERAGQAIAGQ